VQIVIRWYKPGSKTDVQGQAVIRYEWYRSIRNGSARTDTGYCIEDL
jgi:hypothetical protein